MNVLGVLDFGYIWRNEIFGKNIIKKRLDITVCISDWLLMYPMSNVINKPFMVYDHCLIYICGAC